MNVQDDYLFVRFDKYCKTCKHEKLEENEPPCDECLEHPVNLHSHKPVCYEGTDEEERPFRSIHHLKHRRAIWHKSESGWFSVIF